MIDGCFGLCSDDKPSFFEFTPVHPMPVVANNGGRLVPIVDIESYILGIGVECIFPDLGYCGRAIRYLLTPEVINRPSFGLKG